MDKIAFAVDAIRIIEFHGVAPHAFAILYQGQDHLLLADQGGSVQAIEKELNVIGCTVFFNGDGIQGVVGAKKNGLRDQGFGLLEDLRGFFLGAAR